MLRKSNKLRRHIMKSQKGLFKEILADSKLLHNQEPQKKPTLQVKILNKKSLIWQKIKK